MFKLNSELKSKQCNVPGSSLIWGSLCAVFVGNAKANATAATATGVVETSAANTCQP